MIGTDLSHYRILEKIGEGGMGAVYKARDTHLDRFVAIKVLPEARASDAERRRRFIQEAKAASALNHPNIITVHDAAHAEGIYYIVMEYVAGKTVDELIRRKPLRLNEALGYAIQIADALARAHGAGIVHRDLKPSNIMVDEHGQVKVLDFGLAKLMEEEGSTEDETATFESLTEAGTVVGTAAYMSPEQAEGRKVDARTDVFSFGLVLYEMLTGVNPFQRESRISTLSAILNEDPRPVSEHSATLPSELDRAVMRCLRKDPQRRWQSMSDLKSLLEDVREDSESGKSAVGEASRSRSRHWVIWAAAAVVLVAAVLAGVWLLGRRPAKQEYAASRLTFDSGVTMQPTISRDGKLIAYTSDRGSPGKPDIWVRHLDRPEPVRRTNDPVGAVQPSLSPDGSRIVFRSAREGGGLYVMDTLGGEERKLVDGGCYPRFSPDGNWIAFTQLGATGLPVDNKMFIMPAQGGEARPFQPDCGAMIARTGLGPVWSPDSRFLLFKGSRRGDATTGWHAAPIAGGAATKVNIADLFRDALVQPTPAVWLSPGSMLALSGASLEGFNLYRLRMSAENFQITGRPEQLTSGSGLKYDVSASAEGTVLYDIVNWSNSIETVALDASRHRAVGDFQAITSDTATKLEVFASRNGQKLVWVSFKELATDRRAEVRVRDLASGHESVIGDSTLLNAKFPRLSPDGSLVTYRELVQDGIVTMVAPSGGGTPRRVGTGFAVVGFFPGNQDVLILQMAKRLARRALSGGEAIPLAETASGAISNAHVSDDGKRVVFSQVRDDGSVAVRIVPVRDRVVPESEWITVVESRNGWLGEPNWAPNSTAIYYSVEESWLTAIRGRNLDAVTGRPVGEPFTVLPRGTMRRALAGVRQSSSVSVTHDRLYFIMAETTGNLWMLKLPPE